MGFKNPYIEQRRLNIQTLKELIRTKGEISHKKLLAQMGIYGLRKKTILDYLEVLQDGDFVEYDIEKMTWRIKNAKVHKES